MSNIGHRYSGGEQQSSADRFSDIGGNAIVYTYPNGDYDVICAAEKWLKPPGWEEAERSYIRTEVRPEVRQKGKKAEGEDRLRSMRRARAKLRRLALSNSFDWFVTLTLSPEKVDRYDAAAIMKTVNRWLDNMVRRHGLRYILVPEMHKDGAYHFHGFFAGDVQAIPSGHFDRAGHEYFNLPQWGYGFSTAVRLYGDYGAAVAYCCKYIGKQEGERPMGRWYYSGGGLAEPAKQYATLEYRELLEQFQDEALEFAVPGTQMLVVHHREDHKIQE